MSQKLLHLKAQVTDTGDEDGIIEATVASTAVLDRHGDTVQQDGWQLKNFKANPVILWAHNAGLGEQRPPIGKSLKTWVEGEGKKAQLKFKCQFDMADEFAASIYRKVKDGFINMVSVGFLPLKWELIDEEDFWSGYNFLEQELLEISWVPVPANPQAAVEVRTLGFETVEESELYSPAMQFRALSQAKKEDEGIKEVTSAQEEKREETKLVSGIVVDKENNKVTLHYSNNETSELAITEEFTKSLEEMFAVKSGRTLSAKNEALLRTAHQNITNILATLPVPDEDDDDKAIVSPFLKRLQNELKVQDKSIGLTLRLLKQIESERGGEK